MGKVVAGITTSVDGYITGPGEGQGPGWAGAGSASTTGSSAGLGPTTR